MYMPYTHANFHTSDHYYGIFIHSANTSNSLIGQFRARGIWQNSLRVNRHNVRHITYTYVLMSCFAGPYLQCGLLTSSHASNSMALLFKFDC